MFYVWFGIALFIAGRSKNSYDYLIKGLELGEAIGDQKVIGYACVMVDMGVRGNGIYG